MATVTEKIPYYRVNRKTRVGYWEPPAWARRAPYLMQGATCGPDGPEARALARERLALMYRLKTEGDISTVAPAWPQGSLGHFYESWTRTKGFGRKSLGVRQEFEQAWAHVPDKLKRKVLTRIGVNDIESLQIELEDNATAWTRWRTMKKLREIFAVAAARGYIKVSPAGTMPNPEPEGRSQFWIKTEIGKLVDKADELGKPDMALAIQLLWDTMMSPVDVRTLSRGMVHENVGGLYIHRPRSKTGADVYVDLPDATARRLKAYLNGTPTTVGETPIIRGERGGKAFRNRNEFSRRFDTIRRAVFGPEEKRQMRDIRRSGNVAADLGGAKPEERALILANALHRDAKLDRTYTPPTLAKARELRKQRELGDAILAAARGQETGT